MKKIFSQNILVVLGIVTCTPLSFALAQSNGLRTIDDVSTKFINLGNMFLQVLIAFAVIWIVFNVVRYLIVGADSEDSRKTARQAIMWGIIGLAIILSIWGLVNIVLKTFVFNDNTAPTGSFPRIPTRSGGGVPFGPNGSVQPAPYPIDFGPENPGGGQRPVLPGTGTNT